LDGNTKLHDNNQKKKNVGRKTLGSLTNPKLGIVQIIVMESELNLTL
jgi:hypothetical protein